jgi:hypothetical protein
VSQDRHPKKEVREALEFAERNGWRVEKSKGGSAHAWGKMLCPNPDHCHPSINSTPRNPQVHATQLKRAVARCATKHNQKLKP